MKIVFDTNALLDNPEILLRENQEIIMPYVVLSELDKLKRESELRGSVQQCFKIIKQLHKKNKIQIVDIPSSLETNDEKIVKVAKDHNATLITGDIGASIIAMSTGVAVPDEDEVIVNDNFFGYREIDLDYKIAANLIGINEMIPEEAEHLFGITLVVNEYVFYKMPNEADKYSIWRLRHDGVVSLIKQSSKPYTSAGIFVSPQDVIQACAMDAVFNDDTPLAIIDGRLGTGKSLLALCAALARTCGQKQYKAYKKIYVTRAPVPINKSLQLGFMPGDKDEKMSPWLSGIKSNLKFLYERTEKDMENGEAEKVFEEYFEAVSLESIQGMNIHDSILIVDEYQLLDVNMLKQVLGRVASGSKVILVGDPLGQGYGIHRGTEGWKKLVPFLKGTKQLTYVKMHNIYRSELAEFIEEVFR
jgi:PhoH-like ATPase